MSHFILTRKLCEVTSFNCLKSFLFGFPFEVQTCIRKRAEGPAKDELPFSFSHLIFLFVEMFHLDLVSATVPQPTFFKVARYFLRTPILGCAVLYNM